ncbi:peptidoglycan DD-metalloendopeptidase family protein [Candidatus Parcubacteria bacterium]|nr:peptidoglycan DD-metalloendopeptidase family protein [Candidatus Parcubacteria bacterium]
MGRAVKPLLSFTLFALVALSGPAHAEAFSILDGLFGKKEQKEEKNSQTISLPLASLSLSPGPTGVPGHTTEVNEVAFSEEISIYVVRKGDSISSIAKMFGVTSSTIIWANDIQRGIISEGQKLVILPVSGIQYTVKEGDTVKKIADKYKADLEEMLVFNGISLETKLTAGDTLIIPDVEGNLVKQSPTLSLPTSRLRGTGGPSYDGYYLRPIVGGYRSQGLHGYNGVDLAAPLGSAVLAAAAGNVIVARSGGWNGGYGNYVVIEHENGTQTLYAHLLRLNVSAGATVARGELIGALGSTGKSTGPHLHFEVRGAKNPF